MGILRLQDEIPRVYTEESRDFQLLTRLYDCVYNGLKFDIDSIQYITDTSNCRSNLLQLLSTKLGFLTNLDITDTTLRYILLSFPRLIKEKGSLRSIQFAINTYLKIYKIKTNVTVWYITDGTYINDTYINDRTIIIGLETAIKDINILLEVFKFIFPAGYGFYLYFYNSVKSLSKYLYQDSAKIIFISENLNSQLRGNTPTFVSEQQFSSNFINDDTDLNRFIGAINTINIADKNSIIPTVSDTYQFGDNSLFSNLDNQELLYLDLSSLKTDLLAMPDFSTALLQESDGNGNVITTQYLKFGNEVMQVNYLGTYLAETEVNNPSNFDMICLREDKLWIYYDDHRVSHNANFRGVFNTPSDVTDPASYDVIKVNSEGFKIYKSLVWNSVPYLNSDNLGLDEYVGDSEILVSQNYVTFKVYMDGTWHLTSRYLLDTTEINKE